MKEPAYESNSSWWEGAHRAGDPLGIVIVMYEWV